MACVFRGKFLGLGCSAASLKAAQRGLAITSHTLSGSSGFPFDISRHASPDGGTRCLLAHWFTRPMSGFWRAALTRAARFRASIACTARKKSLQECHWKWCRPGGLCSGSAACNSLQRGWMPWAVGARGSGRAGSALLQQALLCWQMSLSRQTQDTQLAHAYPSWGKPLARCIVRRKLGNPQGSRASPLPDLASPKWMPLEPSWCERVSE